RDAGDAAERRTRWRSRRGRGDCGREPECPHPVPLPGGEGTWCSGCACGADHGDVAMTIALVTGGSRGIGAATCIELARKGFAIAIGFRENEPRAAEVARQVEALGQKALLSRFDVCDAAATARAFDDAESKLGPLDALVC